MPTTTRLALPYPAGSDAPDIPADIQALAAAIDGAAVDTQGLFSARPAPGNYGRYYYATDTVALYRDNGTSWVQLILDTDSRLTNQRVPVDNTVATAKITDLNVTTAKIADNAVTAAKIETQMAWTNFTMTGATWSGSASYMKDSLGFVYIKGTPTSSTVAAQAATIATLPAGFRPEETVYGCVIKASIPSDPTYVTVYINTDGTIHVGNSSGLPTGIWGFAEIPTFQAFA